MPAFERRLPETGRVRRLAVGFVFWLLGCSTALAQAAVTGAWTADARSGCRLWNVSPPHADSVKWTGACQGGYAEGRGVAEWILKGVFGRRMEAEWSAGKRNGAGLTTYADGSRFEGMFRDDLTEGKGFFISKDGTRTEQNYVRGKREGYGVAVLSGGTRYAGEWKNDTMSKGKLTGLYEGKEWRYEGEFNEQGDKHGRGAFYYTDGASYVGEYRNGKENGQGKYTGSDKQTYEGQWLDGKPHGRGSLYGKTTIGGWNTFAGNWHHGCFAQGDKTAFFMTERDKCNF